MRLDTLRLRGLLRFPDEVSVDFHSLPEGLIVFVGPNGEGKTTFLEGPLAALYRSFPSRSHKELVDYAHDRDSFVQADFTLDGRGLYRARVNLDAVRRTSEAVLVHVGADGTLTPLNDGKVSTFDEAVARVFPPKEVLLASAFAAQNRNGSFITSSRLERRALFAAFIGLEHYEQMAQTAKTAAGLVDTSRGKMLAVREILARDSGPDLDGILAKMEQVLLAETATHEGERTLLQGEIADTEARLATVQDQVAAFAVATQRVQSVDRELTSRQGERGRLQISRATIDTTLAADRKRLEDTLNRTLLDLDSQTAKSGRMHVDELAKIEATVKLALADVDERTKNNLQVLADADAIRAAVVRVAEIETVIATARADEGTWREKISGLDRQIRDGVEQRATISRAVKDLHRASTDAELIDGVPCQARGDFAGCRFLVQAISAKASVPALQEVAGTLPAHLERQQVLAADHEAAMGQLRTILATIRDLDAEQKTLSGKARLEPSIAAAEARIGELEQKRLDLAATAERSRIEAETRATERTQEIASQRKAGQDRTAEALEDLEVRARGQREGLDEQIVAIATMLQNLAQQAQAARADLAATEAGNQQAAQLQAALAVLRGRWDASTGQMATLEAGRADVERQRRELATRRAELADLEARLRTLDTELVEWQLLAKALARDGLPTLEIDAAGPTVSSLTNDILSACGWARFSVELATQEAKVSGKGVKECFEVRVWDGERGGDARDLADLSGGEQVVIDECLKNALSIYVNTRSETPIRTCWRDETTAALGTENASRYPALLRKVHELGGYHHTLVVTHNVDVAAVADAQIRFADGKAEIVLPPYAA
jgi:exonuclease SbcC